TKDIISTYQRRQGTIRAKEILLDTSRKFYEDELVSLNVVREKNLERIRRYYSLALSSYNYLYLDNRNLEENASQYHEGEYYSEQIDLMNDLILEITTINDLLNPNRGFVVYQLSPDELKALQNPDFRQRLVN